MIFRYCNIAISNDLWWQVGWVLCISWDLPASGHVPVSLMYSFAINIYPGGSTYNRVGMFTSSQFYPLYAPTWPGYISIISLLISLPSSGESPDSALLSGSVCLGFPHVSLKSTCQDDQAWLEFWLGLIQTGLMQSRFPNVIYNGYDTCMYISLIKTRPDSVCWNCFLHLN